MKTKRLHLNLAVVMVALMLGLVSCASNPLTQPTSPSEIQEQRADIRDMAARTLGQLYQQYPEAQARVQKAAGYAAFSDFGIKLLFMGSATGHGMVFNNATRQDTFMKMVELQPGLGFGAQKFKIIFLFDTQDVLNKFVNSGWEFGGSAAAAAQTSTQGGGGALGVVVSPGITMYQLSGEGAIVGISVTGAKYYKNDALN